MRTVCALVSGGVDSGVLVARLIADGSPVQPVYVRAGMAWEPIEERYLTRYLAAIASPPLRSLQVLELPVREVYGRHWSVEGTAPRYDAPDEAIYLPGRNLLLLTKAAVYCALGGIERLAIGLLAGNPFPDATDGFFEALERSFSLGLEAPMEIERPFAAMRKSDVVRLGAHLPLELTFSCVQPAAELHCGDCNKCAERQRGFRDAGVEDPTVYARPAPLSSGP